MASRRHTASTSSGRRSQTSSDGQSSLPASHENSSRRRGGNSGVQSSQPGIHEIPMGSTSSGRCSTSSGRYGAPSKKKFQESDAPLAGQSALIASYDLPLAYHFQAAHFTASNLPGDHSNEDRVMYEKTIVIPWNDASLYTVGVLDGHGGDRASEIVSKGLPGALSSRLISGQSVVEAYMASMADMERELALLSKKTKMDAGTCVLSCTIFRHCVWCANLGDCRAALMPLELFENQPEHAPQVSSLIWLSRDHKASSVEEMQRISSEGGEIVNDCIMGLTPSRTLGDFDVKRCINDNVISIVPEVRFHQLGNGAEKTQALLVCATDGVWDVVTGQDVCHIINSYKELGKLKACMGTEVDSKELVLKAIAEDLVQMSRERGSPDDSTAVLGLLSVSPESEVDAVVPAESSNRTSRRVLVSI